MKRQTETLHTGEEMDIAPKYEQTEAPARQAPAPWKDYLFFTLCVSLYLLPFMRVIFVVRDEGSFLYGAMRIVHGQVFGRDFFEVMGPGSFYLLAAFFKVFGVTFLASRICLFITSLGTALAMYFLTRRVCSRYKTLPVLILAGTSLGAIWPAIGHHVDGNFFALLSIICMVVWQTTHRNSLLIAAGCLAGITACIHLPKGVFLLSALLVWLWLQRRKYPATWTLISLLTGGYLAIVAFVGAYFWSQGALGSLVYANFVFPYKHYSSVNSVVYSFRIFMDYWTVWVKSSENPTWIYGMAVILFIPFLLVAALPLILLLVGVRYKWNCITPEIALYWLCGWALWASELHRKDIHHLVFASPLLIILCIHALTESRRKLADAALQILIISAICLSGLNCCIMLLGGATVSETRAGKVALQGKELELRFLNEHTSKGEEILIYPYCPTLYFLSMTSNPTRYSFLVHNYNTPEQFQDVVDVLDRQRIRYVIWDRAVESKLETVLPGANSKSPGDLIVENYLQSHYKQVMDDKGTLIMERKSEDLAK
jgi:hypothetical protein